MTSTPETAELVKYAANAFLATKVTFVNELARLCEVVGADIRELTLGMGLDPRIGGTYLAPGPGFSGGCFPNDLRALVKTARDFGSPVEIAETTIRADSRHKQAMGAALPVEGLQFSGWPSRPRQTDMRDARRSPSCRHSSLRVRRSWPTTRLQRR